MEPDAFASQVIEPVEFTASGDRILIRLEVRAQGAGSGIEIEFMMWSVWTSDAEGLWIRVQAFLPHEEAEARKAAGLSE